MHLFDTNVLSEVMKKRPNQALMKRHGDIAASLSARGRAISPEDLLIASTAMGFSD